MAELLDRIHAEIRDRLRASEAAVSESERLEAALAALSGDPTPVSSGAPTVRRERAPRERRSAAAPARRSKRAQRGANRAAALRAIGEHPGAGVAELITATGISRGVLYALLGRLTEHGEIVKQSLPGGRTGYALAGTPVSPSSTTQPDVAGESEANVGSPASAEEPSGDDGGASGADDASSATATAESSTAAAAPSAPLDSTPGDSAPDSVNSVAGGQAAEATRGGTHADPADSGAAPNDGSPLPPGPSRPAHDRRRNGPRQSATRPRPVAGGRSPRPSPPPAAPHRRRRSLRRRPARGRRPRDGAAASRNHRPPADTSSAHSTAVTGSIDCSRGGRIVTGGTRGAGATRPRHECARR